MGNFKGLGRALTVNAGAGKDTIDFKKSKYKNKLYGEAGNDTINDGTNADMIRGGLGKDSIFGNNGKDTIYGEAGDDVIFGGGGDDWLCAYGENIDTLDYSASDEIYGGAGDDVLIGQSGTNSLYGQTGDDSYIVFAPFYTYISDSDGDADLLNIYDETYDNLHFVFNVDSTGEIDTNGLRILNNANFELWKADMTNIEINGINIVKDWDGSGDWNSIELFEEKGDENGCSHLTIDAVDSVRADIAGWLEQKGYANVADVFENEKTEGDINTLIGKFDITDKWVYKEYSA